MPKTIDAVPLGEPPNQDDWDAVVEYAQGQQQQALREIPLDRYFDATCSEQIPAYSVFTVVNKDVGAAMPLRAVVVAWDHDDATQILCTNGPAISSFATSTGLVKARAINRFTTTRLRISTAVGLTAPVAGKECGPMKLDLAVSLDGSGLLCLAVEGDGKHCWVLPLTDDLRRFKIRPSEVLTPTGNCKVVFVDSVLGITEPAAPATEEITLYDITGRAFGMQGEFGWCMYKHDTSKWEFVCMEGCLARAGIVDTTIPAGTSGLVLIAGSAPVTKIAMTNWHKDASASNGDKVFCWYQPYDQTWYFVGAGGQADEPVTIVEVYGATADGTSCLWPGKICTPSGGEVYCTDQFPGTGGDCWLTNINIDGGSTDTPTAKISVGDQFLAVKVGEIPGEPDPVPIYAIRYVDKTDIKIVNVASAVSDPTSCLFLGQITEPSDAAGSWCTDQFPNLGGFCWLTNINVVNGSVSGVPELLTSSDKFIGFRVGNGPSGLPVYAIRYSSPPKTRLVRTTSITARESDCTWAGVRLFDESTSENYCTDQLTPEAFEVRIVVMGAKQGSTAGVCKAQIPLGTTFIGYRIKFGASNAFFYLVNYQFPSGTQIIKVTLTGTLLDSLGTTATFVAGYEPNVTYDLTGITIPNPRNLVGSIGEKATVIVNRSTCPFTYEFLDVELDEVDLIEDVNYKTGDGLYQVKQAMMAKKVITVPIETPILLASFTDIVTDVVWDGNKIYQLRRDTVEYLGIQPVETQWDVVIAVDQVVVEDAAYSTGVFTNTLASVKVFATVAAGTDPVFVATQVTVQNDTRLDGLSLQKKQQIFYAMPAVLPPGTWVNIYTGTECVPAGDESPGASSEVSEEMTQETINTLLRDYYY